ncbi:MAG: hypothetical protein J6I98_05410, partial [Clostridia bacterium]|nr:hypothetical protein [Clostridia bacterium]
EVTAKKQQAGGIAGWQSMGLVKNCENTGSVLAADADHVGGISGISNGFIRNCSAKCLISGDSYVGGIAGSASIATDCRSMVQIENGAEKVGEVLGYIEANETEEEDPILGNYYLSVADDRGAVDGISYAGMAEPLERSVFLALEELPELFSTVEVRFVFEDGTDKTIALSPGAALDDAKIPEVPEKDGCIGEWEGLSETDLSSIVFNMTFEAIYTSKDTVIQSEDVRGNGQPLLLVQGTFAEEAAVETGAADAAPELSEDETLLEAWSVTLSGAEKVTGGRLQLPAEQDAEHLHIYLCTQDGTWMRTEFTVEGSYAVFDMTADTAEIALVQAEPDGMQWMILTGGAAAAVVLLVVAIVLCRKRRKKKSA